MAPKDLDKLIEKYLAGNCTKEEAALIDGWYSSLGGKKGAGSDVMPDKLTAAGDRLLTNLEKHTRSVPMEPVEESGQRFFLWRYTGIAACLVACLTAGYYFVGSGKADVAHETTVSNFKTISNTGQAARREILPDGSIVVMAPESQLRFPASNTGASREIFLEGEAYFDVAHDASRPFYVYAGNIVTKVLGTSFIVRNEPGKEKVTVSVKTGKVTVYSRSTAHKKTVLTPNQEAIYDHNSDLVATQMVPAQQLNEEKKNLAEMHFEETPVPEVLAVLMKTYDIDIVYQFEMLSGCVLTSSFYEEGLYDRIDVICTAIGASYKVVDAQIVIDSNGCNLKPN